MVKYFALLLGRYLRPVAIVDWGKTRNDNTKHIHSYLENTSPRTFIKSISIYEGILKNALKNTD